MDAAYLRRSSIPLLLLVLSLYGNVMAKEKRNPALFEQVESAKANGRICQSNEPCYFGYVKVDKDLGSATYRILQTW